MNTSATTPQPALLVLEDGSIFRGRAYGARGVALGEIVFNTAMTGYQEVLTDPSYAGQIVTMTAPHIGNTGVNDADYESRDNKFWPAGLVVRDPARRASSWRSRGELADALVAQGTVGISHLDTRQLTRHLRDRGVMRAGIFSGADLPAGVLSAGSTDAELAPLLAQVAAAPSHIGRDVSAEVSTGEPYVVEPTVPHRATVVALDLGVKGMTPQRLAERGVRVHVVPAQTTFEQIAALNPDGVFFSNGPGDPAAMDPQVALLRQILDAEIPFFGICFGNQLFGRALGFETYKLRFGHRGTNQPVLDRATGRVEITTHNHGFAVRAPLDGATVAPYDNGRYGRVEVTHVALNDDVVEGLACLDRPAFSVQFHPEAAAGPHDAAHLFDRFIEMLTVPGKAN